MVEVDLQGNCGHSITRLCLPLLKMRTKTGHARLDTAAVPVGISKGWVSRWLRLSEAVASMGMHKNRLVCRLSQASPQQKLAYAKTGAGSRPGRGFW